MDQHDDAINLPDEEVSGPDDATGLAVEPAKQGSWIRRHLILLITVTATIVLSAVIYFSGGLSGDIEAYGYLGIFLISILASAVIFIPVPSMPLVILMGAILNPWLVGLMAGLGEPIGEIPSYMAGYSGRGSIGKRKLYVKLSNWMRRRGGLVLFLFACAPNPTFDLAGVAAGALRYSFWKFLFMTFLGKTVKGLVYAFIGYWMLRLLLQLFIG